jgi:hypothetical protein
MPLEKDIPGFEGRYTIASDGTVYSLVKGRRALKPVWAKVSRSSKFMRVSLYKKGSKGKPTIKYIHRLVAAAFLPPQPSPAHEIDHKDEDRSNNAATNLRWVTTAENTRAYRDRHPNHGRGESNKSAKLTESDVRAIRATKGLIGCNRTAQMFGIARKTVLEIRAGRKWRHVK